MNVKELIEELTDIVESHGENIHVMTSSNYGDYHNTEQLNEIASIQVCIPIAYSQSGFAFPVPEENEEDQDEIPLFDDTVVLRYVH